MDKIVNVDKPIEIERIKEVSCVRARESVHMRVCATVDQAGMKRTNKLVTSCIQATRGCVTRKRTHKLELKKRTNKLVFKKRTNKLVFQLPADA